MISYLKCAMSCRVPSNVGYKAAKAVRDEQLSQDTPAVVVWPPLDNMPNNDKQWTWLMFGV